MIDALLLHELLLAVIIGGLTGRLVDFGAVQLLFRPYTAKRFAGLKLHGVLPARQEALARQVANSIAERLLSEQTLAEFITSPEMAAKIRENVAREVDRFVDRDLPSVRELLGELLSDPKALDEEIRVVSSWCGEYLASLANSPEVRERCAFVLTRLMVERKAMRMDELLAPGVWEAIGRMVESRLDGLADTPELNAERIDTWLAGLGAPGTMFSEETLASLRSEARKRIPDWLKALEEGLKRPDTQAWLDRYVLDSVEGFIEDLPRQGLLNELVGWFIRTTYRENKAHYRRKLLEILPGQVARFRESLSDPANRDRLYQKLDQAITEIAGTPLGNRYATIPADLRRDLKGLVSQVLSSPTTRTTLQQWANHLLSRFRAAPLEEFLPAGLRALSAEDLSSASQEGPVRDAVDFGFDLLREAGLQRQLQSLIGQGASFVLSKPIGRLRDRLGEERLTRIHGTIEQQLLAAAQREAPRLARLIDVRGLVETKIQGADAQAIEAMVKNLARKELNSIFTKGLYGGILVSLVMTGFLLVLESLVNRFYPGAGWVALAGVGAALLVTAARYLRIPAPHDS
ncbi:hypothetical protein D3C86_808890 [compost metagenome]